MSGVSVCVLSVATAAQARRDLIPDLPSIEINLEALQRLQHENMSAPVDSIDAGPIGSSRPAGNGLPPRKVPLMNQGMASAPQQRMQGGYQGAPSSVPFGVKPAMQQPTSRAMPGDPVMHRPKRQPAPPEPMYYHRAAPQVAKPASKKPVKVVRETQVEEKPKLPAAPIASANPKSDPFMTVPSAPPVEDEPFMDDMDSGLPDIAKLQDDAVLPTVAPPAVVPMVTPDVPMPSSDDDMDMPDFDDMAMPELDDSPAMPKVDLPPVELPPKKPSGVAPVSDQAKALPDPDFDSMSFENFPTVSPAPAKAPPMGDVGTMEKPIGLPVGTPRPGVVARMPQIDAPKMPDVAPMSRDTVVVPGAPPAAELPPPSSVPSVPSLPDMPGLDSSQPLNPVPGETQMAALPEADMPVPLPSAEEALAESGANEVLIKIEYPQQETQVPVSMQRPLKDLSKKLIQSGQSVRIMGIADPNPDQALSARRAAYSRAMLVRSFLIDNGVNHFNININTRSAEGGEMAERVDIVAQ
ncbi:MAG: hypothetical protein MRY32_07680 [Rickettsiales bacterium]|nr:hypothetical protein [Rickettsiales bacterium]